jgi:membrane associated rhomboid family serine protease
MRDASVGHQCPECVAQGRRTQRPARTAFGGGDAGHRGNATKILIGINVVMLILSLLSAKNTAGALGGSGFAGLLGGQTPLMDKLGVVGQCTQLPSGQTVPCGVADGEYYRLFTAMFMHFGILHLLLNMWALWIIGRSMEGLLGPARFVALYLVAGLGGDVAAYLFQPGDLSAGASTAIFGLFAALFLALRKLKLNATAILPVILINLVFTLTVPGISIAGHLGGLVVGALAGAGLVYAPRANRTVIQATVLAVLVVAMGGLSLLQTSQLT